MTAGSAAAAQGAAGSGVVVGPVVGLVPAAQTRRRGLWGEMVGAGFLKDGSAAGHSSPRVQTDPYTARSLARPVQDTNQDTGPGVEGPQLHRGGWGSRDPQAAPGGATAAMRCDSGAILFWYTTTSRP